MVNLKNGMRSAYSNKKKRGLFWSRNINPDHVGSTRGAYYSFVYCFPQQARKIKSSWHFLSSFFLKIASSTHLTRLVAKRGSQSAVPTRGAVADDLAEHEIQREHRDAVDEQNQDLMALAHLDAMYAVGDGLAAFLEKRKHIQMAMV